MPLYSLSDGQEITAIPHSADYDRWSQSLTPAERQAIDAELDRLIDEKLANGKEILTSSWIPGELSPNGSHEWDRTPFQVLYDRVCGQSWTQTGYCFGLLLWARMMNRSEPWFCMKCEVDGNPIGGTTYFIGRHSNQT